MNARVLAQVVSWCTGPDRIAANAPDFQAGGNQLKSAGYVVAWFCPDWMCNLIRNEMPDLAGKVKLMPLPAWERGGRRTSVWGGTMLGISRASSHQDAALDVARKLYLSDELARRLYTSGDIITPIRSHWDDPVFDVPDAFFGGQPKGRLYIEQAPDVPVRTNSPYFAIALLRVQEATIDLAKYARRNGVYDAASLEPVALEYLEQAEAVVRQNLQRNVFLRGEDAAVEDDS